MQEDNAQEQHKSQAATEELGGAVSLGHENKNVDPAWGVAKCFEEQNFEADSIGQEGMVSMSLKAWEDGQAERNWKKDKLGLLA